MKLPKGYLSYSQIDLWQKDKTAYRKRYYEGLPSTDTIYTIFGRETHERIARGEVQGAPIYSTKELKIEVTVSGVPILAYVDSFCDRRKAILEYKTSKNPWTLPMVHKHEQLPLYSMLVQEKFGEVQSKLHLVWLETELGDETVHEEFDGMQLAGSRTKLALTGHIEVFERTIEQWERDRQKDIISRIAREIAKDYETYSK
jgi:hypothetical protein